MPPHTDDERIELAQRLMVEITIRLEHLAERAASLQRSRTGDWKLGEDLAVVRDLDRLLAAYARRDGAERKLQIRAQAQARARSLDGTRRGQGEALGALLIDVGLGALREVAKRLGILMENERPAGTGPVLVKS